MMGSGMGMMQALNLDKAQRSKLRALMREQRTANCKTMTQMMDVRDELADEYDKDKPDAKAIGKLYGEMQGMQRHMLERHVEMHNKFREMLHKDQQETFDRMFHGGMGMMNMMGNGGMMNMMQ
jgi:Spy/CpxP family protein refolding chaperone